MAGKQDLHLDPGSAFRLVLSGWGVEDQDGDVTEYDLDGATAWLLTGDDVTGDPTVGEELTIDGGTIVLALTGGQTSWLDLPMSYVVAVVLASGEVRHVIEGKMHSTHRRRTTWR